MRFVEERSLSSILRSNLLTILINNDVSGKVNASGVREGFVQISLDAVVTYTCHACLLAAVAARLSDPEESVELVTDSC
jgi:hypothetical protein